MSVNVQNPAAGKAQTPPPPPPPPRAEEGAWHHALSKAHQTSAAGKNEHAGKNETKNTLDYSNLTLDELRKKFGIDAFDGDGLMGIKVNGKDTISDVATKKFVNGLRQDLEDGKIGKHSDEAKLLDLIDAQGALKSGYDVYGYIEAIDTGAGTYRETETDPTHLTGADVKDMLDGKKISQKISDLMGKESITKRYDAAVKEAIANVPTDKLDAVKEQVMGALFTDDGKANLDFEHFIAAAKEKATKEGDEDLANTLDTEVTNYFDALKYLAPDKYASRQQAFNQNMMTYQIDGYMKDLSSVDAKNKETGLRSTIDMIASGINSILGTLDKSAKAVAPYKDMLNFLKGLKGDLPSMSSEDVNKLYTAFDTMKEQLPEASKDPAKWNTFVDHTLNDKLKGLVPDVKGNMRDILDSATGRGLFGSMMGVTNLVSASMQLANGGWDQMSDDERIAAVRDLVGALSFGNDFVKFGANIVGDLKGTGAPSWLGMLDENFPDIWGTPSKSLSDAAKALNEEVSEKIDAASKKLAESDIGFGDLNDDAKSTISDSSGKLGDLITGGNVTPDLSTKLGKTFLRFMGGAAFDIGGGVMDIVTGVHALQNADTELEKAGAGVSLTGGSLSTAFGVVNALKLIPEQVGTNLATSISARLAPTIIEAVTTGLRVLGPVLGIAAAVFGGIGVGIAEAINHEKLQKLTDDQGAFFQRLADMGVAQDDWGDKLEYARYAAYMYGGRDTPAGQSIFDYQAAEWHHFQNTPGEYGSSLSRLAPYLHVDGNFGEENLFEKDLKGETENDAGKDHESHTDDWRPWDDTDLNAGTGGRENVDGLSLYLRNSALHAYGKDFHDDNKKYFDTILSHWDNWKGDDSIVSTEDLQNIKNDQGSSTEARDAAKWLLDNHDFWNALDGIRDRGSLDTKVSTDDFDSWLSGIGATTIKGYGLSVYDKDFFAANKDTFDTAFRHWDNWNEGDDIVSIGDLQDIKSDSGRSQAERDAAQWFLDHRNFWSLVDGIQTDGDPDTKVSNDDLDVWLDKIDAGVTVENYRVKEDISTYDKSFFDDNRDKFDTILRNWDAWNGGDDIVSEEDLQGITSDSDRSQAQVDAAQWMLDNPEFRKLLDGIRDDGQIDTKISNDDFNAWLDKIGAGVTVDNYINKTGMEKYGKDFYDENKVYFDTMKKNWDDWNGGDSIVSEEDLQNIKNDPDRSQAEIDTANWLLDQHEFFKLLDGFQAGGDLDTKISNDDFNTWLEKIGVRA